MTELGTIACDAVKDAATVMGLCSATLDRAVTVIRHIDGKGVVTVEEMRQLADAVPGTIQFIADGMDKEPREIVTMARDGQLLSEDALPAFSEELTDRIRGVSPPLLGIRVTEEA